MKRLSTSLNYTKFCTLCWLAPRGKDLIFIDRLESVEHLQRESYMCNRLKALLATLAFFITLIAGVVYRDVLHADSCTHKAIVLKCI